jgi:hypothetical protein
MGVASESLPTVSFAGFELLSGDDSLTDRTAVHRVS